MHRLGSTIASLTRIVRRAKYRRADLWRMSAEMVDGSSASRVARIRWLSPDAANPSSVLECPTNFEISYAVTLPAGAVVVGECGLTTSGEAGSGVPVTFEIELQLGADRHSVECTLELSRPPESQFWRRLSVRATGTGAARVTFRTRSAAAGDDSRRALWRQPSIETPRPPAELMEALRGSLAQGGVAGLWRMVRPLSGDALYQQWIRYETPNRAALAEQRRLSSSARRLFSLITIAETGDHADGRGTVKSVIGQTYPQWEWIIVVAPGRAAPGHPPDPRIRVINLPSEMSRAAAWTAGLGAATGEFAALLDLPDELAASALYEMGQGLDDPAVRDVLYCDEDRFDPKTAVRLQLQLKPDWSPERLLASNYVGRLSLIRRAMVQDVGGFREAAGAEEWDLLLRLSAAGARVKRVPRCLYHRASRSEHERSPEPSEVPLRDHFGRRGLAAEVTHASGHARARWQVSGNPKVSIVIPNRDAAAVFSTCAHGLLEKTGYSNLELVVVDNGSTDPAVIDLYRSLAAGGKTRVVPFDQPFNFSAACNRGAEASLGELLLFLNNDIEVIEPEWLEELVRWAQLPEVGVVGAKLLFPDRTVQHAGVVFGLGLVGHLFAHGPEGAPTLFGSTESYRNYLAVTGACQMMRRDVFRQLGGFDERFRLVFSDVVFCMKAWRAGYRVVYTPYARLIHHESHTRKRDDSPEDMELLARYLRENAFEEDPYFHPALNPRSAVPALRPPLDPTGREVVRDYVQRVLAGAERRAALGSGRVEAR